MPLTKANEKTEKAREFLAPFGLSTFGWFVEEEGRRALLVGNIGSSLWPSFSASKEFHDGEAHSLDRWTVARMTPIAAGLGAEVRFPFGGTIWPFQQYAKQATGMQQSPIGLLVHSEFGLWMAFRAVLVFEGEFGIPTTKVGAHPCDSCEGKPCLSTCPIGAFTDAGYDYKACKSYVKSAAGTECREGGCLARQACPVGQEYAYEKAHKAFHMAAYV